MTSRINEDPQAGPRDLICAFLLGCILTASTIVTWAVVLL